jgi:hypothetical protein
MYMREMGVVDLLEQEDEIRIAKEIEAGVFETNAATAASAEVDCALAPDSTTKVSASGMVSEITISSSSRMVLIGSI